MVVDCDKLMLRGVVIAILGGGGWYYLLGPGSARESTETASGESAEQGDLFRQHARAVSTGDSLSTVQEQMRRRADRIRKKTDATEEHVWTSSDGQELTITVDVGSQKVTEKLIR